MTAPYAELSRTLSPYRTTWPVSAPADIAPPPSPTVPTPDFEQMLAADRRSEWRLFWVEMVALACMAAAALWTLGLIHFRL